MLNNFKTLQQKERYTSLNNNVIIIILFKRRKINSVNLIIEGINFIANC
jgi:hypothetical protein